MSGRPHIRGVGWLVGPAWRASVGARSRARNLELRPTTPVAPSRLPNPVMHPKLHALIPLLALTGCLARDISRTIDGLECHESTGPCPTGSSGGTTNGDPSGMMTTTPSSDTGVSGETDGQTNGTSTGDCARRRDSNPPRWPRSG